MSICMIFPRQIKRIINSPICSRALQMSQVRTCSGSPQEQKNDKNLFYHERVADIVIERHKKAEQDFKDMIQKETAVFEIGKRHLANIMGMDPEHFTQEDIDNSLKYLLPSGLFDKRAQPMMKPPTELFAKHAKMKFDTNGRPLHFLYYTARVPYYEALHNIAVYFEELDITSRSMANDEKSSKMFSRIINKSAMKSKGQIEELLGMNMSFKQMDYLTASLDRLCQHPYSYLKKDFLMKFRIRNFVETKRENVELEKTADGRPFVVKFSKRKTSTAVVTVTSGGSGKITINGNYNILYFESIQARQQVLFPLQFANMMTSVDVDAKLSGGGSSGQSNAMRHALSMALDQLVDEDMHQRLKIAGLLTKDIRRKERKKPGQEGARRKFTWKKR